MRIGTTAAGTGRTREGGRAARAAAGGALLALLLAACGGGSATSTAATAGTSTTAGAAAHAASASSPTTGSSAPGARSGTAAGAKDLSSLVHRLTTAAKAKSTAKVTLSSTTAAASAEVTARGAVRLGGRTPDMALDMVIAGQRMRFVFLGGALYLKAPSPVDGKAWIKIAAGGRDPLSRTLGPLLQALSSTSSLDTQLATLQGAKISSAFPGTVDGNPVTVYTIPLTEKNLTASLGALSGLTPAQRKAAAAQFKGATGRTRISVDGQDLVRRVESTVTTSSGSSSTTATYAGWGEPVTIAAPPASLVADLGAASR